MQITIETLTMRVYRIRQMIAECPKNRAAPENIQYILETAPKLLFDIEKALQSNTPSDPALLNSLHHDLEKTESLVCWATKMIQGEELAKAIRADEEIDPSIPAEKRLLNRIAAFLATKIDGPTYFAMVKEFAGEAAVSGNTVYMEPVEETESFSQWLIYDICLPGQPKRIIDQFFEQQIDALPDDEKELLRLQQKDRPSIYKLINLSNNPGANGIYLLQDLLAPGDSIRIWDLSSSKSLSRGSIVVGRAIPYDAKSDLYRWLGVVNEIPEKLWAVLSSQIDRWRTEYYRDHPRPTPVSFYRAYHACLRRKILEITEPAQQPLEVNLTPDEKRIIEEIHNFVIKRKRKGKAIETVFHSPHILNYMEKFKFIMDTCTTAKMDYITATYEGFYQFALLLENLAAAIRDGKIKVP